MPKSSKEISTSQQKALKYSELKHEIQNIKETTVGLDQASTSAACNVVRSVAEIPLNDADTLECVMACQINKECACFLEQNLPNLNVGNPFTVDTLLTKLEEMIKREGWNKHIFQCDPITSLSLQRFQCLNMREAPPPVVRQRDETDGKKKRKQNAAVLSQPTQPSEVNVEGETETKSYTKHVLQALRRAYKANGQCVEFWSFVLDPDSFEVTIENMFSVNILVNACNVKLLTDKSSGNRYLTPLKEDEASRLSKREKVQGNVSLSPAEYLKLITKLGITSPMIPAVNLT